MTTADVFISDCVFCAIKYFSGINHMVLLYNRISLAYSNHFPAVFTACDRNVCQNGGTCRQHVFSHQCECSPGFTGVFCENSEYSNFVNIVQFNSVWMHLWEHLCVFRCMLICVFLNLPNMKILNMNGLNNMCVCVLCTNMQYIDSVHYIYINTC